VEGQILVLSRKFLKPVPLKRWYFYTTIHGATSQMTGTLRVSNFPLIIQTGSVAHPVSYQIGVGRSFRRDSLVYLQDLFIRASPNDGDSISHDV